MHPIRTLFGRVGDVECLRIETVFEMPDRADLFEIAIGQNRLAYFKPLATRIAFEIENVRAWSDEGDKAHHQFFADRINRRIRHLREVLLEIGVKQLRLIRHCGNRRVGAHGANGFLSRCCHWLKQ